MSTPIQNEIKVKEKMTIEEKHFAISQRLFLLLVS